MKYIRPHLSPELRAQITPSSRRDVKLTAAGVVFLLASVLLTVNLWPKGAPASISNNNADLAAAQSVPEGPLTNDKAVLGEATQATPAPEFSSYKVKTGDTLFNISQQYNIRWDLIAQINSLSEPYVLHAGQTLKIPQATTSKVQDKIYTVRSGETLVQIAKLFNVTVNDIVAVNPNLQNSDLITPGQVIKLP